MRDQGLRRILVWSMDRLGDAVRSTAAVRMLKKGHPSAEITVVAAGRSAPVWERNPSVDHLLVVPDPFRLWQHGTAWRRLKGAEWELGVLLELDPRWARLGRLMFRLLRVRRSVSLDFKAIDQRLSWAEHSKALARQAGGANDDGGMELFLDEEESASAARILSTVGVNAGKPFFVIHPGGNDHIVPRRWPPESYARLLNLLAEKCRHPCVLVGTPPEAGIIRRIKDLTDAPVADLCGRLDLRELMAVIARCRLFISNDSGPLHIAHALKVPSLVLLGPTAPSVVGIPPTGVVARKDFPSSPCAYFKDWKPCPNPIRGQCLLELTPEEVLAKLLPILS